MQREDADEQEHETDPPDDGGSEPDRRRRRTSARRTHARPSPARGRQAQASRHDPYWWTPYAVMGTLQVIGLLGLFVGLYHDERFRSLWASPAASAGKRAARPPRESGSASASRTI